MQCFHCGLPAYSEFSATVAGEVRHFCCAGCQAVATLIHRDGLDDFYRYRDSLNQKPDDRPSYFDAFDDVAVQREFVTLIDEDISLARLHIDGVRCAACAWLIEKALLSMDGVHKVHVNVANHLCSVQWNHERVKLSVLMSYLRDLGYAPEPAMPAVLEEKRKTEKNRALMRLAVAGIGMMQVGMVAIALHAGALQDMHSQWQDYLRWISLIVATPVVFFSAQPFFRNAWQALRLRALNMDVPVALAIGLAFIASVYATVTRSGEVYFDSVSMFTFFLLAGRFLEMVARHRSSTDSERLAQLLPTSVQRYGEGRCQWVPLAQLKCHDVIVACAGSVIPCDGLVKEGSGSVDESLLTGESEPVIKRPGDSVVAGSIVGDSPLNIEITALGQDTGLAAIEQLVHAASTAKPRQVSIADRLAGKFVAAVLIISTLVACAWLLVEPAKAFWVALSLLVVTCPCALSLATPAALTAGIGRLRDLGVLVAAPHVIETLPSVTAVVFDKTGTLTQGRLSVAELVLLRKESEQMFSRERVMHLISALEYGGTHPIAHAFSSLPSPVTAKNIRVVATEGVEGNIDACRYRFGRKEFALAISQAKADYPGPGLWQLFADEQGPIAWVLFEDSVRKGAVDLLNTLKAEGKKVVLASGDRSANVVALAKFLSIDEYHAGLLPEQKLTLLKQLQAEGHTVLVVGDGINDVPLLAGGDISMAMGSASQLAKTKADTVLLNPDIRAIHSAMHASTQIKTRIRQNLTWALAYNLVALPIAALGWVPPYLAALGMSLSSLIVVINSVR